MITIIIPTYRTPKMVAFTISQILQYSEEDDVEIIIINNYPQETETIRYLQPFIDKIKFINYPENKLQSHGVAIDYAIENGYVSNDYFLMLESDAYPTKEFIPYYQNIIEQGFDSAGSMLKLSGGLYQHPCGSLYSKEVWYEAKKYCDEMQYSYFPNMNHCDDFDYHMMVHNSVLDKILDNPNDFFELSENFKPYSKEKALEKREWYKPTVNPFHNGMGGIDESVRKYGDRGFGSDVQHILLNNKRKTMKRVGYEPGQWLSYFMVATGKKIFSIPMEIKWMEGRENQQQEYTINEAGIHHVWGVSSYTERTADGVEDIYESKRNIPNKLYETLPEHQKIKE